jgi:hypothetical protein
MSERITPTAIRQELTLPTLVAAAGAAVAHWLALRHSAAHPSGGSVGFWLAFFGPCVFSLWLSIEQLWHRAPTGMVTRWVIRQLILVPSLIVLTALFGVIAVGGAAQTGYAASPDDYSGPTKWLIDNLVLGFMINVVFALLVSIAGVLLVLLPAGVLHARREMRDRDPNVTAADLTGVTVGGFVLIGLLALVFVVPTLLVVANDQSGTTQLVLRIVGIALGVVGFGAALVIGSLKRSGASRDG